MKIITTLAILTVSTLSLAGAPGKDEQVDSLLAGGKKITSLTEITKSGLNKADSKLDVWSGSYWPQYQGSIAVRYLDPMFRPMVEQEYKVQWKAHHELREANPVYSCTNTDNLSPAEKYDMLVGDREFTLTKYAWDLGKKNGGEASGKVPTWRGICDGWSSASQKMPRPVKDVVINDPDGKPIRFFPEDIKALGSLLYARAQSAPAFLGKRCRMPLGALCGDINPATFHLALINRVGGMGQSFIADIAPGREVWNYPVKGYEAKFYNVFTDVESADFTAAMESFDKKKKFKKRESRHPETAYIVGVKMTVNFADMRLPYTAEDKVLTQTFTYDLELNARMEIVGGEGVGKLPDFIWAPLDRTYPLSLAEKNLGAPNESWDIPNLSRESAMAGQPLSMIVQRLFEASKK